ncbi:MAG: hypothetical protein AAGG11_23055, partial [Pseudomonadota bacterium]
MENTAAESLSDTPEAPSSSPQTTETMNSTGSIGETSDAPDKQVVPGETSESTGVTDAVTSVDGTDTAQTAGEMAAEAIVDPSWVTQAQGLLEIGGPVVTVLALMSFAALTIVIVKVLQFAW